MGRQILMQNGNVIGAFGKKGLCLLFLDRICFGRDMEV